MKKSLLLLFVLILIVAPLSGKDKGHISFTAKASIYDPPGDTDLAPMFTLEGRYRLNAYLSIVGSGSWTKYDLNDAEVMFVPVAVDGELHPLGKGTFDPYVGVGLSFNYRQYDYSPPTDDETELNVGTEFLGGVSYKPSNQFGFEFDVKYRIEDLANMNDSGSWSVGGGVTGSWEQDL